MYVWLYHIKSFPSFFSTWPASRKGHGVAFLVRSIRDLFTTRVRDSRTTCPNYQRMDPPVPESSPRHPGKLSEKFHPDRLVRDLLLSAINEDRTYSSVSRLPLRTGRRGCVPCTCPAISAESPPRTSQLSERDPVGADVALPAFSRPSSNFSTPITSSSRVRHERPRTPPPPPTALSDNCQQETCRGRITGRRDSHNIHAMLGRLHQFQTLLHPSENTVHAPIAIATFPHQFSDQYPLPSGILPSVYFHPSSYTIRVLLW